MTVLALVREPALPAHPLSGTFVMHARSLRAGAVLEDTARFDDDVWSLMPIVHQDHLTGKILDFTTLPDRWRPVGKELSYALLSGPLPPGEIRPDPLTVRAVFTELKRFFTWLDGRPATVELTTLGPADLLDYQRHLRAVLPGGTSRARARAAVRRLWSHRANLTSDRLTLDPRRVEGWGESHKARSVENATQRIPEHVFGPLLAWALRFVDEFAADILTADGRWHQLHTSTGRNRREQVRTALPSLLDEHLRDRRPLPGYAGQPNLASLARTLGCSRRSLDRHRDAITAAAATVGLAPAALIDVAITGRLDGRPWLTELDTGTGGIAQEVGVLARLLQTAGYIVIAFLSGMRDSEIKHLRHGCLSVQHDADGVAYRWKVSARAFKGEQDAMGTQATWVVGQPVARAVEVLQLLQPHGTDLLFATLLHKLGRKRALTTHNAAMVVQTTNRQLNEFAEWVNTYCGQHQRDDVIPQIDGRPWRFTSSQFRRTLAWFLARRPGGTIAGAIQYRHLSIQMFEGYAGTSDSGFRAEVESEQALTRGEHLLTMIDAHEHQNLAGPAAQEADHRLAAFGDQAGFRGTIVTDHRRLLRIMTRHDPAVYPGDYVTCVFDPAKALCQRTSRHRPELADCRPLDCRNVALTSDNIAAWKSETDRITARLQQSPALPPLLQHQLQDRLKQLAGFVAQQEGGQKR